MPESCVSNFLLPSLCFLEAKETQFCFLSFARYVSGCGSTCVVCKNTSLRIGKSLRRSGVKGGNDRFVEQGGVEPMVTDVGTGNSR